MKKVVKNLKEKFEDKAVYTQKEMKRYLGSLNEIHGETLKGIKEGFVIVNRKIDGITIILDQHTEILDQHTEILDQHTKILDQHTKILDQHTKKLNSHTEMIGVLMEDVSILKSDVSIIKTDLKKRVDYDEFMSLVKRVQQLESKR